VSVSKEGDVTDVMERVEDSRVDERKRLDSIWWAVVFIMLGSALAAEYLEWLPETGDWSSFWPWFLVGLGVWSVALNLYRAMAADAPNPTTWDWIWTAVFALVALGTITDVTGEIVGPAALVIVGVIILTRASLRRG
jgi:uncharacterized membrane protein YjjP (DUF1212 family)